MGNWAVKQLKDSRRKIYENAIQVAYNHLNRAIFNWRCANKDLINDIQGGLTAPNVTVQGGVAVATDASYTPAAGNPFSISSSFGNINGGTSYGVGGYVGGSIATVQVGNVPAGTFVGNTTTITGNIGVGISGGFSASWSDRGELAFTFTPPLPVNPGGGAYLGTTITSTSCPKA